ncbi:MAG: tape measure protein [Methanobrevibacter sp.]|nr:tape measure protein [Methanobrevibacter sp.]MBO7712784.1 tape measure protein [Methanobrevibacter sp.]
MNSANGGNIIYKFTGDKSGLDSTTKTVNSGFKGMTSSMLAANLATKAVATGFNMIKSNATAATSRLDTMKNFPKVMSNLGISTKEAQKSIDKMSDKLLGLPTTLDAGALAVQRFASKNGDVKKSTDIFLALNNAILAGGTSADIQANALEQLSQAYAKGKPDMMEWRAMQTAMPAQLKQVAQAMGYVDAAMLGEAVRAKDGEKEFSRMIDTMLRMNTEGVEGFKSFEEQARNSTGGLITSITNMKSRIAGGLADLFDAINYRMEKLGLGSLADNIAGIGTKVKKALDYVAKLIKGEITAQDFGKEVGGLIAKIRTKIAQNLPIIIKAGIELLLGMLKGMVEKFPEIVKATIGLIITIANTIIDNIDTIINSGVEIILAIADGILENIDKIIDAGITIIIKLINKLTDQDTLNKLGEAAGKIVVALTFALIKAAPKVIEAAYTIAMKILQELLKLPGKMVGVGRNIIAGIWQGITERANKLARDLQNWADGLVKRLKKNLKIGSPSKLFANEIGRWIPEGVALGITANTDSVYKAMSELNDLSNYGLSPQLTGSMNNHYSPSVAVTNNIDVSTDPLGQTVKKIKTFSGGAKNDYNYGMGV